MDLLGLKNLISEHEFYQLIQIHKNTKDEN